MDHNLLSFSAKLERRRQSADSLVCVGLDPDVAKLPAAVRGAADPLFEFGRAIIDATAPYALAFKPQIAYYAAAGAEAALAKTLRYLRDRHPDAVVILDAKRGDIGTTAELYAKEAFDRYGADAVTVNPYLGGDTLEPFLRRPDKGVFVLCRTSNPGAGEFQGLATGPEGEPLFQRVARAAVGWNARGNVGLVAGATWPGELAQIRALVGPMPLLVPGIGAQGGDLRAVLAAGRLPGGGGLLINSSRAILNASAGPDFAEAAGAAARALRDAIRAGG